MFWQLSERIEKRNDGRLNVGEVKGGKRSQGKSPFGLGVEAIH